MNRILSCLMLLGFFAGMMYSANMLGDYLTGNAHLSSKTIQSEDYKLSQLRY